MACLQHPKAGERWLLVRWVSTTSTHPRLQTSAVAWGECGLDYAKNNSPPDVQRRVFAQQIVKAVEVGKPLVVHSRKAEDDTIAILKENMPKEWHVHVRVSVPLLCPPPPTHAYCALSLSHRFTASPTRQGRPKGAPVPSWPLFLVV